LTTGALGRVLGFPDLDFILGRSNSGSALRALAAVTDNER